MRRPRTAVTTDTVTLVYMGQRALVSKSVPKLGHVYSIVPAGWESLADPRQEYEFGRTFVFKKCLGSKSIGVVESYAATENSVKGVHSHRGFWPVVAEVVNWQGKHSTTVAEAAAWRERRHKARSEMRNVVREHLAPLREAMLGMTRNEQAVFLSMVYGELLTGQRWF